MKQIEYTDHGYTFTTRACEKTIWSYKRLYSGVKIIDEVTAV